MLKFPKSKLNDSSYQLIFTVTDIDIRVGLYEDYHKILIPEIHIYPTK